MSGRGGRGAAASASTANNATNAHALTTTEKTSTTPAAAGNGDLAGRPPDDNDWSTYFCTYAYLYHQKDMLEDHTRTGAYAAAILGSSKSCFEGKVVLDVGAGSGILSIFAARAGAKKVYAVEATPMAVHARTLVKHNNLDKIIEVLQGTVESVELPEKVDVIVSEWMGYLLLRESMLDSVLAARDAFLKPNGEGSLWPSHARLLFAPARSSLPYQRAAELDNSMSGWDRFADEARRRYGVDVSCLTGAYRDEQELYYSRTAAWGDVDPSDLLGEAQVVSTLDLAELSLEGSKRPLEAEFDLLIEGGLGRGDGRDGVEGDGGEGVGGDGRGQGGEGEGDAGQEMTTVDALVGFFDVSFRGGKGAPGGSPRATEPVVTLSTEPCADGATHWGQQVFPLSPPLPARRGDRVKGKAIIRRRRDNPRLLEVEMELRVVEGELKGAVEADGELGGVRRDTWQVE